MNPITTDDRPAPAMIVHELVSVGIQWKGTDACLDLHCSCGVRSHFDGGFAYVLKCGACGQCWKMPEMLMPTPLAEEPENARLTDVHD